MSKFKRPRNGHFTRYCGECARWSPVKHEYCDGLGLCEYDETPSGVVSLGYFMSDVARDQYEVACPLFERRVK